MKNLKKIIAALLSMTAIASTTAFAATEATYTSGTASLALAENDITAAADDQLTVVIVPKAAESISSANIYYINQGAFGEEFTAILNDMKVKDGYETDYNEYEIRIGGVKKDGNYAVETFYFKADAPTVLYGDADADGYVLEKDASRILLYRVGEDVEIDTVAADADGDGYVLEKDASRILLYRVGEDVTLGHVK